MTIRVFLIITLGFFCSCKSEESPNSIHNDLPAEISDSLSNELASICKQSIIPGFSVAILDSNGIVYKKGFGYASLSEKKPFTTKSINCVASISKTLIGVAIMKLIEMDKLNLEEEVNDILAFDVVNPHFPNDPIKLKHLVRHSSGLTIDFDPEDVGEADIILLEDIVYDNDSIQKFMDNELAYYKLGIPLSLDDVLKRYLSKSGKWYSESNYEKFKPGTKYSYSNIGAELAARIIEIKSGMSFDAFTKKYIFDPLKMKNTKWFHEELDSSLVSEIYIPDSWDDPTIAIEHPKYKYAAYPSGGLRTNIDDLSKYLHDMMNGFHGKGSLLRSSSYRTLFEPILNETYFDEERDESPLNDEFDLGVFWAVSSTGIRLHNGGSIGVYSFMYFDPITKSGAIGFCNLPDRSFGLIRDAVYKYERRVFAK